MLDSKSINFYNVPHDGESPVRPEKGSPNTVLVKRKRPRKGG
jgi:hypothetical protein